MTSGLPLITGHIQSRLACLKGGLTHHCQQILVRWLDVKILVVALAVRIVGLPRAAG
jgi:hypothetical protein